ncbi:exosome nuclease subunit [Phlyctochytrium bullatum]|nr:exosome nuclease subunit [Phlyctochytrium bullatum]
MDTHYLLYIYDRMRNDALLRSDPSTKQLLHVILRRSEQTALKLYEKDYYDSQNGEGPNGWRNHLKRFAYGLTHEQIAVFKAIHAWRDHLAREEDESLHYVLPTYMLMNIASEMPKDAAGVLSCCNPIPNFVRLYASDLVILIEKAVREAKNVAASRSRDINREFPILQAKENDYALRLRDGHVHLRFNEDNDVKSGSSGTAQEVPLPKDFFVKNITEKNDRSSRKQLRAKFTMVLSSKSDVFTQSYNLTESSYSSWDKSQLLRESLYFAAPSVLSLKKRKADEAEVPVRATTAKEEPVKKPRSSAPFSIKGKTNFVEPDASSSLPDDNAFTTLLQGSGSTVSKVDADAVEANFKERKTSEKIFNPYSSLDESDLPSTGRKPVVSSRISRRGR